MHQTNKAARIAGAIYLALAITAPFSLIYVPGKLVVHGDAMATAGNILAHETLFRFGIVASLFTSVIFIAVGFALYHLLHRVNKMWAGMMMALVLVSAGIGFLNNLNNVAALLLVRGGEFLAVFDQPQRNALAMLFLRLHRHGDFMNEIFWGLWLLPFGLLVYRSGFLPRFLGLWLILNCCAYLLLSVLALLVPTLYSTAFRLAMPALLGELAITLWLLVRGAQISSSAGGSGPESSSQIFVAPPPPPLTS